MRQIQTQNVDFTRAEEALIVSKVAWRILPFVFFLYVLAYLDRVNVSFAALQMKDALHFSDTVYGFGSGIFFIGYFLFEVPSNLILERVGARVWIARIMISWGIISTLTMFVHTPWQFYTIRFLLGVAEAGFFPGMLLYFTYWFPAKVHAQIISVFMTALAASGIIGPPISGFLLNLHGTHGLAGWQWVFLLEGAPSIVAGFFVLRVLDDRPADASWLRAEEKLRLQSQLAIPGREESAYLGIQVLRFRTVWTLAFIYFLLALAINGLNFWLPQLIAARVNATSSWLGVLTAVPYAAASVGMVFWGRRSDLKNERRLHLFLACLFGAVGLIGTTFTAGGPTTILALCVAVSGSFAALGPFWSISASLLPRSAVASGLALINSVGNLGGFCGPFAIGLVKQSTNDFMLPLLLLATSLVIAGALISRSPHQDGHC